MKRTLNKCTIMGDIDVLDDLKDILQKGFSMNDLVPCKSDSEDERIRLWGTTGDIDLIAAIYNKENYKIDVTTRTEVPNPDFWLKVSYNLCITVIYSYYVDELDCIGYYKFMDGEVLEHEYSEDIDSNEFKDLCTKLNFPYHKSTSTIINMEDILKRKKDK